MNQLTHILHLEDDALDAELIQTTLESAGIVCQINRVQNRDEFTQALQQGEFDLILADYRLSALRLAQELRPELPFIFVSGILGEDAAIDALTQGATDYVLKQNLSRLATAVERALREAENRQERQRAEEALRESEGRYRLLAENASDIIFTMDMDFHFTYISPSVTRMRGYSVEEAMAQTIVEVLTPASLEMALNVFQEVLEIEARDPQNSVQTRKLVLEENCKDGSTVWTETTLTFLHNLQDQPIGLLGIARAITERKQAEEALHLQSTVLEAAANGIVITDRQGTILWVNSAFTQLTGYSAAEAIGQNPRILKSGMQAPAFYQNLWNTILSGQVWHSDEVINRRKDGVLYTEEMTITPVPQTPGEISHFIAIKQDVTERKRVEQELARAKHDLEQFFILVPDLVAVASPDGYLKNINPEWEKTLGHTVQELLSNPFESFIHPDDIAPTRVEVERQLNGGATVRFENRYRHKDGSYRWLEWNATPAHDNLLYAAAHDITERKRLAQDLERHTRELAAFNRAARAITSTLDFDRLLDLIINEIKNLVNAQAASVLLYEAATDELVFTAVVGPGAERLLHTHMPATAGIAGWVMREKRSTLVSQAHVDQRFYPTIDQITGSQTGSLIAVPLSVKGQMSGVIEAVNKATGLFDERDLEMLEGLAGAATIAIDNARLYQREREQHRQLQQTQAQMIHFEKMSALGRLLASMAHEINNPLQAVQGCLGLALEELSGRQRHDKLTSYLNMAAGEIDRIAAILNRTRDFYRPASQEVRLIDVHSVLHSVLELANKQLERSKIVVEREWAADLLAIAANADHLEQVFLNLVLNAIDAMAGGGVLHVRTRPDLLPAPNGRRLPAVRIEFTDTGEGIPPEMLPRIFEPFFTAKKGGTGLGLSISYGIIEAHGGQITAISQVGQGTTFTIVLPVDRPQEKYG